MKRLREFVFSLVPFALATVPVLAQTGTVTGVVQDASGQPLAGAQVAVEGTSIGGLSTDAGRYLLNNVPVGDHDITVVLLGYATVTHLVTVLAGETTVRDFELQLTALSMDEIVVTATGEQRRREIGNAIAKIETSMLTEVAPVTSFQELLQGRASGVSVIPSDGTVGTGARIRIRGISSATLSPDPLVYVDGIRVNSGSPALGGDQYIGGGEPSFFNDLNPEEIERHRDREGTVRGDPVWDAGRQRRHLDHDEARHGRAAPLEHLDRAGIEPGSGGIPGDLLLPGPWGQRPNASLSPHAPGDGSVHDRAAIHPQPAHRARVLADQERVPAAVRRAGQRRQHRALLRVGRTGERDGGRADAPDQPRVPV